MLISLIIATLNRVDEVEALLQSLVAQNYPEVEVIIVDQNDDDRLILVIERFFTKLSIRHIYSKVRNVSHARNLGIPLARGEIIGFPDDDCIYPPDVLSRVITAFQDDSKRAVLSGPAISPEGRLGSGRWQTKSVPIDLKNVWTTVIEFNLFIRAAILPLTGPFDETLGVGARFGSCEGPDLVIRTLKTGAKCDYDFALRIVHPDKSVTQVGTARAFIYGTGLGRVLRKHRVPFRIWAQFLIRPIGGTVLSLLKMNFLGAAYYWQTLRGRISGFTASQALNTERRPR